MHRYTLTNAITFMRVGQNCTMHCPPLLVVYLCTVCAFCECTVLYFLFVHFVWEANSGFFSYDILAPGIGR